MATPAVVAAASASAIDPDHYDHHHHHLHHRDIFGGENNSNNSNSSNSSSHNHNHSNDSCCSNDDNDSENSDNNSNSGKEIADGVEVAIIGNGPAGILLSMIFSGYEPYYSDRDGPHPTPFLHDKLKKSTSQSLLFQDLKFLSEGLEGRSANAFSLLFDTLFHPQADVGDQQPSRIAWKYEPSQALSHVVIGCGPIGGTWHTMYDCTATLSKGHWMELPIYSMAQWAKDEHLDIDVNEPVRRSCVGQYYTDYVQRMNLGVHFRPHSELVDISTPARTSAFANCLSSLYFRGVESHCPAKLSARHCAMRTFYSNPVSRLCGRHPRYRYLLDVRQISPEDGSLQRYLLPCNYIFLATGRHCIPRSLGVPGADLPYVVAGQSAISCKNEHFRSSPDPILVVGSGLSAADAVRHMLKCGVNVVHICFKGKSSLSAFRKTDTHPFYTDLYYKMRAGKKIVWPETSATYHPLPDARVVQFFPNKTVEIFLRYPEPDEENPATASSYLVSYSGTSMVLRVQHVIVLVGSMPNLRFLRSLVGKNADQSQPQSADADAGHSAEGDAISHLRESSLELADFPNIYIAGGLAGDDFVRFVLGSAFGAANMLYRKRSALSPIS